jgi:hypothetical protein
MTRTDQLRKLATIDNVWWTPTQGHPRGIHPAGAADMVYAHAAKAVMKSLALEHLSCEDFRAKTLTP